METALAWLLWAGAILGHLGLIVLLVNVAHGIGWRSRCIEPLTMLGIALSGAAVLVLAGWSWRVGPDAWPLPLRVYGMALAAWGLVALPLSCRWLSTRERPRGVRGSAHPVLAPSPPDYPDPLPTLATRYQGTGKHAWMLRLPRNEALHPILHEWHVPLASLPATLHGMRLLHLTDLHLSQNIQLRFYEHVVESLSQLDPDLVLLTGDIIEDSDCIDWITPLLGRLSGRLGQFFILGNHDVRYGEARIRTAMTQAGFSDLDGRWTLLGPENHGARIALGGTSAPWGARLDPHAMPAADCRLVMSHSPDQFPRIARWDAVDFMLCGHTHGGQARLPAIGPVLMPSLYSRRYDQGFFQRGRTLMYVSRGLGAKHPIRWRCHPEITHFVLESTRPRWPHATPATLVDKHN